MTTSTTIAIAAWPLIVLALLRVFPPRQAVLVALIAGWLFLPVATFDLPGIPPVNKLFLTCLVVLVGIFLFDLRRVMAFRPAWIDLPMLVSCLSPLLASLSNHLGLYDGLSAAFEHVAAWGVPYFIGRLYFGDLKGLRLLALGILIGGLVYVPLCLFEILFGPESHARVYGYYQANFMQALRFGGWRPVVFMDHGLMVALWMAAATLIGIWLWQTGTLRRIGPISLLWAVGVLLPATILLKSVNGWLLLAVGLGLLFLSRRFATALFLWFSLAFIVLYILVRASGIWTGYEVPSLTRLFFGPARAQSVEFRIDNENGLAAKARRQPLFGWGRWARSQIFDTQGAPYTVADSLWIITFGEAGALGLGAVFIVLLLPVALFARRVPVHQWFLPQVAPATILVFILLLYGMDNLLNAMVNPIYMVAAGGLAAALWSSQGVYFPGRQGEEDASSSAHPAAADS